LQQHSRTAVSEYEYPGEPDESNAEVEELEEGDEQ
jgi:hypothetical protein